jgi:hypothetical protein
MRNICPLHFASFMIFSNWRKGLIPIVLSLMLLLSGCFQKEPSRFAQAQKDTTTRGATPAVVKDAEQGSSFNKFFPADGNGYDRVFSQEKKGFAEAKLNKGGKNVAVLSVSDTSSSPLAAKKYEKSTEKLNGFPLLVEAPVKSTGVLVNQFQVKVASRDVSFTEANRLEWLKKFNLAGLSKLK